MNDKVDKEFRDNVYAFVSQIPKGKVMTYGQIATLCGHPNAARIVGGIAHFGDPSLAWQRVVKMDGSLAEGYPGGVSGHRASLQPEGITFIDNKVDMEKHLWQPAHPDQNSLL